MHRELKEELAMGCLRLAEQVSDHARVWEMGYSPKTVLEALGGIVCGYTMDSWFFVEKRQD